MKKNPMPLITNRDIWLKGNFNSLKSEFIPDNFNIVFKKLPYSLNDENEIECLLDMECLNSITFAYCLLKNRKWENIWHSKLMPSNLKLTGLSDIEFLWKDWESKNIAKKNNGIYDAEYRIVTVSEHSNSNYLILDFKESEYAELNKRQYKLKIRK